MKALIQRVTNANVNISGDTVGEIGVGLVVLLGVEKHDDEKLTAQLIKRLLAYRVFADQEGKMNLSLNDINGSILLVSQFTLAANTKKGLRPGFSSAAAPAKAQELYELAKQLIDQEGITLACGQFGADMQVSLTNDGPVTFLLEV